MTPQDLDAALRHARPHLRRLAGNDHDADDALQEAAVRAWAGRKSLTHLINLGAWIRLTAVRALLYVRRAAGVRRDVEEDVGGNLPSGQAAGTPEDACLARETLALVGGLTARRQRVLALRLDGWSTREVADATGSTPNAVKNALLHAVRTLREAA